MSNQRTAVLRVCASCEWVFRNHDECPKCGFGHYGARFVYGNACYRYEKTQTPWLEKKMSKYRFELLKEIESV